MSFPRVCLLTTPSPLEVAWRLSAVRAANLAGWAIVDPVDDPTARPPDDRPTLILSFNLPGAAALNPTDWVILTDTPWRASLALAPTVNDTPDGKLTLLHLSIRYADAASLAAQGVPVIDARAPALTLPGLGEISPAIDVPPSVPDAPVRPTPLDMYRRLPPIPGDEVEWKPSIFSYCLRDKDYGGSPRIDLTGRGRLLMHGPALHLSPGHWSAELKLSVEREDSSPVLRFEWGHDPEFAVVEAVVTADGFYSVQLDRLWTAAGPAHFRLWIVNSVFEGRLDVLGCSVRRLADGGLDAN